ncbi:16S rRNA (cytosine(1402)-N(4))-methyltransferase RsmH [Tabrizicola caldifontis]|uniref:16S rRNA (cytosine(1402)-N(4))-methyltransferase RsmH n=1 Tax=Tabrizicola caldifontis TaxID=2528036 RepID=UPI001080BD2C|nr:16S rRNA (cytosine(1402)-N(4))-methyltransferase RsmH [Rhodobacter sp. YIM 73028]
MQGPLPGHPSDTPHIPVLIDAILRECAPIRGVWLDGTLGAGGYTRALLQAGAERVIGIDRDPLALRMAADWAAPWGDRVRLVEGTFSDLDTLAGEPLDGVVLDLGVSSMQLDLPERGFSFLRDGPLDMRMSQQGQSATDLVNSADEAVLADILFHYGEERAARRIARAIVAARAVEPIVTTARLAEIVAKCLPRPKPGQSHPATRSFQAIRIAVNAEFSQLAEGLAAAERALKSGGLLAVVTFHSLEDRIVKRFLQLASGHEANANRYAPARSAEAPRFDLVTRRAIAPDEAEIARNPRARSARLRIARRTAAPAKSIPAADLGLPDLRPKGRR